VTVVRVPASSAGSAAGSDGSSSGEHVGNRGDVVGGFTVVRKLSSLEAVDAVEWSPDSSLLLCVQGKRNCAQVVSVEGGGFSAKVSEGVGGLVLALFAPDSRHVITVADFQLHFTIWSLQEEEGQKTFMHPKLGSRNGFVFSEDGAYLAVAHRRECKDSVSVYATTRGNWERLNHFAVQSADLEEICWTPENDAIIIRDSPIVYQILVYNPADGSLVARYSAYENALGVKCMQYSSINKELAVGSFDGTCRFLDSRTWRLVRELNHPNAVPVKSQTLISFQNQKETEKFDAENQHEDLNSTTQAAGNLHKFKVVFKSDPKKPMYKAGVGIITASFDSQFFATRDASKPCVVWIWHHGEEKPLAVLEFASKVMALKWDPCQIRLAIATGDPYAHIWTPKCDASLIQGIAWSPRIDDVESTPWEEPVINIHWNNVGNALLLVSKSRAAFSLVG